MAALGQVLRNAATYDAGDRGARGAGPALASGRRLGQTWPATPSTRLANTHFYAGHYDTSDSLNRLVLAMNRRLYGDRHPMVADDLINLGASQFERGDYPDAEPYDRQALDITQAWYGEDHRRRRRT